MSDLRSVSRRSFLTVVGISSTAALLSACGLNPAPPQATTAPVNATAQPAAARAPQRGGQLLLAAQNDTQTFDPHRTTGGSAAYGMVYNTLIRWEPQSDGSFKAAP
ncbi:MAG: hypothetical protein JO318_01405, partial [Chloroflexi bacterium]|nr:hypothetical protein [Chloroflexota bacterium]